MHLCTVLLFYTGCGTCVQYHFLGLLARGELDNVSPDHPETWPIENTKVPIYPMAYRSYEACGDYQRVKHCVRRSDGIQAVGRVLAIKVTTLS